MIFVDPKQCSALYLQLCSVMMSIPNVIQKKQQLEGMLCTINVSYRKCSVHVDFDQFNRYSILKEIFPL